MFPFLFLSAYFLDLFTTVLTFFRGAYEANPMGWPQAAFNNTVALTVGLLGFFTLFRYRHTYPKAIALAWAILEAAGVARIGLVVVNNVLVLVTGFGFADAVGFHGVLVGTVVLTAVLAPLFFLLARVRILHARAHVSTARD